MKKIVLKHKLKAAPKAADFDMIDIDRPECPDAGILVKVAYISIDPYVGHLLHKGHIRPNQKPEEFRAGSLGK